MSKPEQPVGKILLALADQETAEFFTALLVAQGHGVHAVTSGNRAVELVQELSPDILLLSRRLPDVDARELCQRIQTGETGHTLAIVFLSETADPDAIAKLIEAGASDVFVQPASRHLILSRIDTLLELAELRHELARRDGLLQWEAETRRQVEEDVRAAEQSGRDLVENLTEVIYTANVDGVLTYVSPGIERLLGYAPAEAIGHQMADFLHPEARTHLAPRIQQVLAGNRGANEYQLLARSGETRWVQTSSQPLYADGQVIGLQGVLTDITERKQAEEQIRQQNEFLTTVLESLTHPFYVINVRDYTIQIANSAARTETLAGNATCYALTHRRDAPCDTAEHPCPIEELKKTGRPVKVEHVHYDPDGAERFVEVHSYPLFDSHGRVERAIEYTLDITERKLAEAALRESEARWRLLTERSPDHVILLDKDLRIRFLNYPSPGLTAEELIGTPLYAYVATERQQEIKGVLESVLETAEPASYETTYTTPSGDSIYYESRVVPRTVDGEVVGLAVNARDITEHKRTEQALRERRQEADQRRRVAESLAGVMAALNSDQPLDRVLDHIAAQARELLGNDQVSIYALVDTESGLALQATQGSLPADREAKHSASTLQSIAGALTSREAVAFDNLAIVPSTDPFRALLAVPVVVQDQLYGGVIMCSIEPRTFSAEEKELAGVFGNQVALAVESARLRREREEAAAAAERNRLARDLHDSVSQALFSASLVAEVLPQVWERDPNLALEGLQELGSLNRGALAEMRTMLLELRPTAVVEASLSDLVGQLAEAVTSRAELLPTYNIEPSPTLPPDVHVAFYRIAQEALNNVLKHAGATHVTVSLVATPPVDLSADGDWSGHLTLVVSDGGQGFEQDKLPVDRLGLGIMRERAEAIGAELSVESAIGQGTRLTLMWPREEPEQ